MSQSGAEGGVPLYSPTAPEETATEDFEAIEPSVSTGDVAILQRAGQDTPHYGIFVRAGQLDPHFPLLLVKTKTKPLNPDALDREKRNLHLVTAQNRIFYGDYESVFILALDKRSAPVTTEKVMATVKRVQALPYSDPEAAAIAAGRTPEESSAIACTLTLSLVLGGLGLLDTGVDVLSLRPGDLRHRLPLRDGEKSCRRVNIPHPHDGPMASGEGPLLSKLARLKPLPGVSEVPLDALNNHIKTGDIILFSGVTNRGSVIKIFTHSNFSHCGIAIRPKFTTEVFVFESTPNRRGAVDLESGKVLSGVQLTPLQDKVYSGWYDRVAVRHLKGIDNRTRESIYLKLVDFKKQVHGKPYEKNYLEMIRSSIKFSEDYLAFLHSPHEDLSSLFCSELVAAAYQFVELLSKAKPSNNYTPDDFASGGKHQVTLQKGYLEGEVFIQM